MNFRWIPRVWSQGSADSGDLLSYPSLPELESFYGELQKDFSGFVSLEKAGHSVQGQPIWLLTITDQDVNDEEKQRVLMVGQEHGQERSGSLALLELARWLVTPAAAEIRRKQSIGLIPVVNPDSWEDLRFNNVNDVNLYADFSLDGEPTQPESQAMADILERMQPELFCSLHGTEFGWKYRMGESNGFSWTTSQFDRSHSRLFIEEINRAAESAGFPQDRGEEEAERILPWLPGNIHHSYYSGQRVTSCVHAYHRYHTLSNTMEVHHPRSGLIRCITMLELGNQPWRTEAVAGYPVRTMFQQDETFVAAYGQSAAERRASRVELWGHTNQFLVARGVNEPVGMAVTAFSLDPEDYDRWRAVEIDPFLQQYGEEQGIDVAEVRAACGRYPRLQSLRCDQIKPVANAQAKPLLRVASQGLALRLRLPRLAALQRVWLDGRPIGASPVDGYENWNTRNGFTMVQFNVPPRADSERFQRHLIAVAYRAPRIDRGEVVQAGRCGIAKGSGMSLKSIEPGMKLAVSISAEAENEYLTFLKQMGIDWVTLWTTVPRAGAAYYLQVKRRFAEAGLRVYGFGNGNLHNQDAIVLGLENRDTKVEEYKLHLRGLGEADIPYTTYAHMANGVWSSAPGSTRGGASARSFDAEGEHTGYRSANRFYAPLSHGRVYSEAEIWDNFRHFIAEVAPVAEEEGVRIGIHPDDPPQLNLGGVPRCIFSSFDGYLQAMDIADSPNIGICFCIGCWLEGGALMGKDTGEALREFGRQEKVFKVHFRNVDRPLPRFVETFVDDGYYDMRKAIEALKEIDFDGVLIPDHVPMMGDDPRIGAAYTIGWIKAMLGEEGEHTSQRQGRHFACSVTA